MVQLADIRIYPIKSLAGLSLASTKMEPKGLALDRRWMLVDARGRFLSQREDPQMALIQLEWIDSTQQVLQVTHRQRQLAPLLLPTSPPATGERISVTIWEDELTAVRMGKSFDDWFSHALARDCRLVYMPPTDGRPVDPAYARPGDTVSFADGFPYLLANEASLQDLNQRLELPVTMDRFRPNLIVKGAQAWEEDKWTGFRVGNVAFRSLKPCARCILITVDPLSGKKSAEPLKTLSSFRKNGPKVLFGINTCWDMDSAHELKVGDQVIPRIPGT